MSKAWKEIYGKVDAKETLNMRLPVKLLQATKKRAAKLKISTAEYVRILLTKDLNENG